MISISRSAYSFGKTIVKKLFISFYIRQLFQPNLLGIFTNPYFFARRSLYKMMKLQGASLGGRLLDIGCGSKPYQNLCAATEYVGMELDTPENRSSKNADIFYDGKSFPFPDASFDSVILNQVLEHVFEPDLLMKEISRVLKTSGKLLITVPFFWDEHEQPYDYARYTSFGLKYLVEKYRFEIQVQEKATVGALALLQLFTAQIFQSLSCRSNFWNLFVTAVITGPLNCVLYPFTLLFRGCGRADIFLDNFMVCRKN